ncbi:MAG: hypothetical protein QXL70_01360 [Metallosphaera sp.]
MERIISYFIAVLLDVIAGSSPFLHLPLYDDLGVILLVAAVFSYVASDLSVTLPISLLPFSLIAHSYSLLLIATVSSALSFYLKDKATSFLTTLTTSLVVFSLRPELQVLSFLLLIGILVYLGLDLRGTIANGILFMVIASILLPSQGIQSSIIYILSDITFYSIFFGVIGLAIQGRNLPKALKRTPLLFLPYATVMLTIGVPSQYYWWTESSFLFKSNPLSLWVEYGYFPQLNQIFGTWPLSHFLPYPTGVSFYMFLLTYLSGLFSYLMFKRLGVKRAALFALAYQLLSPFYDPYLLVGYAILPLTAYLMTTAMKVPIKYTTVALSSMIGSSFPLFIISAILLGYLTSKRNLLWFGLVMVGSNAFWIVPYLLLGSPHLSSTNFLSMVLILPIVSILMKFGERDRVLLSLISLVYLVSGLPLSQAFYPVAIASTLLAISGSGIKKLISGVTIAFLLLLPLFQFATYHPFSLPSSVQAINKEIDNATLVSWNYSYPYLSSVPINLTPLSSKAIQYYVTSSGGVEENPDYVGLVSAKPILYNLTRVNYTLLPNTPPILTINSSSFYLNYSSAGISYTVDNNVEIKSLIGYQFIGWSLPKNVSNFTISFKGSLLTKVANSIFFLAKGLHNESLSTSINFTVLEFYLKRSGPLFIYDNGFKFLGNLGSIPENGSLNFSFSFLDKGNYTFLYMEEINGREIILNKNTTLASGELNSFGFIMPLRDEINLSSIEVSYFFPINFTDNWVSWYSPYPSSIKVIPSYPLSGTIYFFPAVKVEVNGQTVGNGSFLKDVKDITINSSSGFHNLTLLKLVYTKTYYLVGKLPVNTSTLVRFKYIFNGEGITIESHLPLNVTIEPLGLNVKVNGQFTNSTNFVLPPGRNVISLLYPGASLEIFGLYISLMSFIFTVLSGFIKDGLRYILKSIDSFYKRFEQ